MSRCVGESVRGGHGAVTGRFREELGFCLSPPQNQGNFHVVPRTCGSLLCGLTHPTTPGGLVEEATPKSAWPQPATGAAGLRHFGFPTLTNTPLSFCKRLARSYLFAAAGTCYDPLSIISWATRMDPKRNLPGLRREL